MNWLRLCSKRLAMRAFKVDELRCFWCATPFHGVRMYRNGPMCLNCRQGLREARDK